MSAIPNVLYKSLVPIIPKLGVPNKNNLFMYGFILLHFYSNLYAVIPPIDIPTKTIPSLKSLGLYFSYLVKIWQAISVYFSRLPKDLAKSPVSIH